MERFRKNGRGGEIRTRDLLYPIQARYQATLRPDAGAIIGGRVVNSTGFPAQFELVSISVDQHSILSDIGEVIRGVGI